MTKKKSTYSDYPSSIINNRQPQGLKSNHASNDYTLSQYHSQNKSLDQLDSSIQFRNQEVDVTNDFSNHFQNPQVSTHKIYVHSMLPSATSDEHSSMQKVDNYLTTDPCKSYTTFSPSITNSERDKQRVAYQAEFTVKSNSGNPTTLGLGGFSRSAMAKSVSTLPTDSSMPVAFHNPSSHNFETAFYQSPMTKSFSNFSIGHDEASYSPKQYFCQDYVECQVKKYFLLKLSF